MRTVAQVIEGLTKRPLHERLCLSAPGYVRGNTGSKVGLAVESMKRHTTNEGWEIFAGLEYGGYRLFGHGILTFTGSNETNVRSIVQNQDPSVVVIQDKREWEGLTADKSQDPLMRFKDVGELRKHPDIFKVTILKDAQHQFEYNREYASDIGCHAWIVYYHPRIVNALAPFTRYEHLIRTYHTVNPVDVPTFDSGKPRVSKALLSGALSDAYPLRQRIHKRLPKNCDYRMHPGYHRRGCDTPKYLEALSHYKVAICTSSRYGYALRKIIEATACGCKVITDLPEDDVLPNIDGNLIRVESGISVTSIDNIVREQCEKWNPDVQRIWARRALEFYDYRVEGQRLATAIDELRGKY